MRNRRAVILRVCPYPFICGLAKVKTPAERLNLQPREIVQVGPKQEIVQTINGRQRKNRGTSNTVAMGSLNLALYDWLSLAPA